MSKIMEWQPIAEAPRDGSFVDIYCVTLEDIGLRLDKARWCTDRSGQGYWYVADFIHPLTPRGRVEAVFSVTHFVPCGAAVLAPPFPELCPGYHDPRQTSFVFH